MELLWEVAGWGGALVILGAFMGVSMGWMKTGKVFQVANLVGACAFIVNGAWHGAWPSVVTNVVWFLISAVALFRMRGAVKPAPAEAPVAHRPGAPVTTSQLAIVEPTRAAGCA